MICRFFIGVFVFLFFISVEQSKSQTSKYDNINKLLQTVPSDTGKITTYLTYGKIFERSNPDIAWFYYEKAHRLALKNSDERNLSRYNSHALIFLNDSTLASRVRTNIKRIQLQYKAAQKDEKIAEQQLQLIKNRATINRVIILLIVTGTGFIILLVFIIIGYRFYLQRQKLQDQTFLNFQKEQEVLHLKAIMRGKEDERRRISSEIHDDIGSALTTIMFLCNNLKQNGNKKHDATIDKISETAGTVVDKMNEIIWSMNKNYNTLEDLITYIRRNSVELLENNGLNHHFCIPDVIPSKKISGEKRRNVYLVVKEALHNIIKHAKATEVNIEIRIGKKDQFTDDLHIAIHDNGIGLKRNHISKFGNGMANMKNRMETIGGKFLINCESGTMVCISLPIKHKRTDSYTNHV